MSTRTVSYATRLAAVENASTLSAGANAAAKPRKRNTTILFATNEGGRRLWCVFDNAAQRTIFGPASWKTCVAWRKEHAA